MHDFVPASAKELFEKMHAWNPLRGQIHYDEKSQALTWLIADDLCLAISIFNSEGTIAVLDSARTGAHPLTHWHSDTDTIYEELIDVNTGKIRFAYVNTLFGKHIVSIGSQPTKKKHHFRPIHYLGEKALKKLP